VCYVHSIQLQSESQQGFHSFQQVNTDIKIEN
jgi:hypothetical protein